MQFTQEDKLLYAYNSASWAASIFPVTPYRASLTLNQELEMALVLGIGLSFRSCGLGVDCTHWVQCDHEPNPVPVAVKMWLLYDKENPEHYLSPRSDFLQNGNSSGPLQAQQSQIRSHLAILIVGW